MQAELKGRIRLGVSWGPINDVTARGKAETRDRLCPVPFAGGSDRRKLAFAMQEFGTRNQTLRYNYGATSVPIPWKRGGRPIFRYNFLEARTLRS